MNAIPTRSTPGTTVPAGAAASLRHPLVQQACHVATPAAAIRRHRVAAPWSNDPDRLVMVSCLVSFLVLPFVL
jgi:hypothetical protein